MKITDLQNPVWKNFYSLTQIPRPSGHCDAVREFLLQYGRSLGLESERDEIGNVLIRKPATKGMENRPGVILQAHMDMVPQKNTHHKFDFEKDPINAYIDGNWVTADNTTLGADDGMGVAVAMTILADNSLQHPDLEAFFTVDEETGMYGAFDLKGGWLRGKYLLNLDSETEGELYVGCAGGVDSSFKFPYIQVPVDEDDKALIVTLKGLKGGHSGCDIHLQRGNANKLLFRFLKEAIAHHEARLACVQGGSLRNSIPREATALLTVPEDKVGELKKLADEFALIFRREFDGVEDSISFTCVETEMPEHLLAEEVQDDLVNAIVACPDGRLRMIDAMPDIVETSNNLAMITTFEDHIEVLCLTRSSVETRKQEVIEAISSVFSLAGAKIEFSGSYPGWKPNLKSELLQTMQAVYRQTFGSNPRIVTIHAGLECGIIGRNYPDMQMISYGPTIMHPHTPDEKVLIESVDKFYTFTVEALKELK